MNLCPKFRKPVFLINVYNYWHHENEFFITSRPNRMMDRNGTIRAEYLLYNLEENFNSEKFPRTGSYNTRLTNIYSLKFDYDLYAEVAKTSVTVEYWTRFPYSPILHYAYSIG